MTKVDLSGELVACSEGRTPKTSTMRKASSFVLVLLLGAAACAHQETGPTVTPRPPETRSTPTSGAGPTQYLVADPGQRANVIAVPLGGTALGLVVDKTRIIAGRGEPRVGADVTDETITKAHKLPQR